LKGINVTVLDTHSSTPNKILISWSGGKDAALVLYYLQAQHGSIHIELLTNVNSDYQTIAMHGVPVHLLRQQAAALDLPLTQISMPEMPTNAHYENTMALALANFKTQGVDTVVFGDIFLEDLRNYREQQLAPFGMKALFPLWKISTHDIVYNFIALGFKAIVCCVNGAYLSEDFLGKIIDADFVKGLPANVDPCGENGEFHSFVFDGPNFKTPVTFIVGEKYFKKFVTPQTTTLQSDNSSTAEPFSNGFWYCKLVAETEIEQ